MSGDEDKLREVLGDALADGFQITMDMLCYGTGMIGPDGRRIDPKTIRTDGAYDTTMVFDYDDAFAEARLSEHVLPLRGEVRGGRFDGLQFESSRLARE